MWGGAIDYYGVVDPLAEDMKAIDQALDGHLLDQQAELKQSLILGADKWGQSVLLKTIKGAETSIIVGLVAAFLAVVIGTVLGAISGYFGGWVDDVLNQVMSFASMVVKYRSKLKMKFVVVF